VLSRAEKDTILSILREGYKGQPTFEKRVRKAVDRAVGAATEEVLYAVFGVFTSQYVEFESSESGKFIRVRLHSMYGNTDNNDMLATLESILPA